MCSCLKNEPNLTKSEGRSNEDWSVVNNLCWCHYGTDGASWQNGGGFNAVHLSLKTSRNKLSRCDARNKKSKNMFTV